MGTGRSLWAWLNVSLYSLSAELQEYPTFAPIHSCKKCTLCTGMSLLQLITGWPLGVDE